MKITGFKRLAKEDFPRDQQDLIEKLATIFNPYLEQVYTALNKNVTFDDNINVQTVVFRTKVDDMGVPTGNKQIKYTLKTRPKGSIIIKVTNLTDNSLLSDGPHADFDINNDIITINQITGILSGKDYDVTIMFIGN